MRKKIAVERMEFWSDDMENGNSGEKTGICILSSDMSMKSRRQLEK